MVAGGEVGDEGFEEVFTAGEGFSAAGGEGAEGSGEEEQNGVVCEVPFGLLVSGRIRYTLPNTAGRR